MNRICIIPRSKHSISRRGILPEALKVLYRLRDKDYLAYLVGGSVRDLLLGITPKDFDVGTDALPEEIRKLFRWSKIIGRRFRLVQVYFKGGKFVEVVTFRGPETAEESELEVFGTPYEDAFRRDLTINALFYNIADLSIIDYVGGMKDLEAGIVRVIGDPDQRFMQDPVRMMRAIRHAARIGFVIEPNTWAGILRQREKLSSCPAMRIRDEWLKDIFGGWSSSWIELMLRSGLFGQIFPNYQKVLENGGKDPRILLLKLLARSDKEIKLKRFSQSQALALFIYPFIISGGKLKRVPHHAGRAYEIIRKEVIKVFFPYDFKKELFENTVQLLTAIWPIKYHLIFSSRIPKRLTKKSYFKEAFEITKIILSIEKELSMLEIPKKKRIRSKDARV